MIAFKKRTDRTENSHKGKTQLTTTNFLNKSAKRLVLKNITKLRQDKSKD